MNASTQTVKPAPRLNYSNVFDANVAAGRKAEAKSGTSMYRGRVEKLSVSNTGVINLILCEVETASAIADEPKWREHRGGLVFNFKMVETKVDVYNDTATLMVKNSHQRWETKILPREESTD